MLALAISDFSNGQDAQGFFADDFKLKKAVIPDYEDMRQPEISGYCSKSIKLHIW